MCVKPMTSMKEGLWFTLWKETKSSSRFSITSPGVNSLSLHRKESNDIRVVYSGDPAYSAHSLVPNRGSSDLPQRRQNTFYDSLKTDLYWGSGIHSTTLKEVLMTVNWHFHVAHTDFSLAVCFYRSIINSHSVIRSVMCFPQFGDYYPDQNVLGLVAQRWDSVDAKI